MTKNEYVDFIRNTLPLEDKTNKFHPGNVEAAINLAVNTVFYEMYAKNPKVMIKSLERYTTIYEPSPIASPPTKSAITGRYQSTLPYDVVDLPRKTGGIIDIIANNETPAVTKFVPVNVLEGDQLIGSEGSLPGNIIGYSFNGARTIEYWDMSAAEATVSVVIRFIKQFKGYSATDNVLLPYGQDERIIELVRQYLGVIPPKDLVNDNADANG